MATPKFRVFHHIDQRTIEEMFDCYSPVFVLSTGRSGSKYIHRILSQARSIISFHEATPILMYFSNFAYHNQHQPKVLQAMFQAARMELLLDAYNKDKTYIESNQCLVFFTPVIKELFKNVRFIHLVRNPGDFVRSAIMKGWHANDSIWESGRVKMKDPETWNSLSHIEKLAWVWSTTNSFISDFLSTLPIWQHKTVRMEDLVADSQVLEDLLQFIGCHDDKDQAAMMSVHSVRVNELQIHEAEPPNMHKISTYPAYSEWDAIAKESLRKITGKIAGDFGYEI